MEKLRIHGLILQADAKQQQVQESIATRPRGGARDELISELIQSRLAVSRAQMNAEASVSEQMIEEQQEVIAWLWRILEHAGMTQAQVTISSVSGIGETSRIKDPVIADVCCDVLSNSWQKPYHVYAVWQRNARNKWQGRRHCFTIIGNKPNRMKSPEPRLSWDTQGLKPSSTGRSSSVGRAQGS